MPDMRNMLWLIDGDGHLWQRPDEDDLAYAERQRRLSEIERLWSQPSTKIFKGAIQ